MNFACTCVPPPYLWLLTCFSSLNCHSYNASPNQTCQHSRLSHLKASSITSNIVINFACTCVSPPHHLCLLTCISPTSASSNLPCQHWSLSHLKESSAPCFSLAIIMCTSLSSRVASLPSFTCGLPPLLHLCFTSWPSLPTLNTISLHYLH